jgi:hypothetical protein
MGGRVELEFKLGIIYSDTMRNYRFSQKLKLLGYGEFNHLTNILTALANLGLHLNNSFVTFVNPPPMVNNLLTFDKTELYYTRMVCV